MAEWTFQNSGWRQGTIVPREFVPDDVQPQEVGPEAKFVIVSHDCDIVQDAEVEPFLELIVARPVTAAERDSRLLRGRNPRRLQLQLYEDGAQNLYEMRAHDRFRMARQHLSNREPSQGTFLDANEIAVIAKWLSRRYKRYSFPTAFNNRIPAKNWNKLQKVLERDGDDVQLFVALNSHEELPNDQSYEAIIFVSVPSEVLESDYRQQRALKVVTAIAENLSVCAGISVVDVQLRSEADISIEDARSLIEWDAYDYLSVPESEAPKT